MTNRLASLVAVLITACGPRYVVDAPPVRAARSLWRPLAPTEQRTLKFPEDRPEAPPLDVPPLPEIEDYTLPNGVRVVVSPRKGIPVVTIRAFVQMDFSRVTPASASLMAEALFSGTTHRTGAAIRQRFDEMGAKWWSELQNDFVTLNVTVPSPSLKPALVRIADVLCATTFPEQELNKARGWRVEQLENGYASPATRADVELGSLLFANGPFHAPVSIEGVRAVQRSALLEAYRENFSPNRTTLVIAGDIELAAAKREITNAFGAWAGSAAPARIVQTEAVQSAQLVIVEQPNDAQASLRVAWNVPTLAREEQLVARALGNLVEGRLIHRLRVRDAVTYEVNIDAGAAHGTPLFVVATQVDRASTVASLRAILNELEKIRNEQPNDEAVARAAMDARLSSWWRFRTTESTVGMLSNNIIGLGISLPQMLSELRSWTPVSQTKIRELAKELLKPETMKIVVVGAAASERAEIEKLAGVTGTKPLWDREFGVHGATE